MRLLYILALLLFSIVSVHAEKITIPKPIIIGRTSNNNYQVIFPLGWSESGNFAYIHQDINPYSAAAHYPYNFIVQNMKTDEILFKENVLIDREANPTTKEESSIEIDNQYLTMSRCFNYSIFLATYWPQQKDHIAKVLKTYNIKYSHTELKDISSLSESDVTLGIGRKYRMVEQDGDTIYDESITTNYSIIMLKGLSKQKSVYKWDIEKDDEYKHRKSYFYLSFKIQGYFKSPYENRVALIVFKQSDGFEEIYEYPFCIGADLENGFK